MTDAAALRACADLLAEALRLPEMAALVELVRLEDTPQVDEGWENIIAHEDWLAIRAALAAIGVPK